MTPDWDAIGSSTTTWRTWTGGGSERSGGSGVINQWAVTRAG
jgi:hypothetical protein